MGRMLLARPAVLLPLQLLGRILLVLHRRIVFVLALSALKQNDFSH